MKETIKIRGVDPKLLNKQRLKLHEILDDFELTAELQCIGWGREALEGILNMLDAWWDDYNPPK